MRVLVLGHKGMLGHMVVKYLKDNNINVITIDKKYPLSSQQIKQFKNVVSQYKSFGKQKFFELNPKIKNRIDEMDELFKETGKRR